MSLIRYKQPMLLLEIPFLITASQTSVNDYNELKNEHKIEWLNINFHDYHDEYLLLIERSRLVLDNYPLIKQVNKLMPIGTFISIVFQSQVIDIKSFTLEKFKFAAIRTLLLHQYDGDQDNVETLRSIADAIYSEGSLNYHHLFQSIDILDCDKESKFNVLQHFNNIEKIYHDFLLVFKELSVIYLEFSQKYEYIIDEKMSSEKAPHCTEDLAVERWVDLSSFDITEIDKFYFSYSFINYEGKMTKLGLESTEVFIVQHGVLEAELTQYEENAEKQVSNIQRQIMALGDEKRFSIYTLLLEKECYLKEIADNMSLSSSTVSHHVEILSSAGLLKLRSKGKRIYYSVNLQETKRIGYYFNYIAEKKEVEL